MDLTAADRGPAIEARLGGLRRLEYVWLVIYPILWVGLFTVSGPFWFLPAGLRLATLWLLPRRRWLLMALAEWSGIVALNLWTGVHESQLAFLVATILPWLVYAAVVRAAGASTSPAITPQSMVRLLLTGLGAASANGLALTAIGLLDQPIKAPGATIFMFAIGDFLGIVTVAPLLLILRERALDPSRSWQPLLASGAVLLPAAVVIASTALPLPDNTRYPVMLAMLPLLWLAFHYGWRACAVAMAMLGVALGFVGPGTGGRWEPGQLQLLIAALAGGSLLLGVSSDALRTQGHALRSTTDMLSMRTQALRDAANRLASQQEQERRRLGAELHDQLGQDMTAIATRLRLTERRTDDPQLRDDLRAIGHLVSSAHTHLRDAINHLHPLLLDRFGLARALAVGPVAEMVRARGIDYRCLIRGEIERLPTDMATTLYRICQEAATNGVRHGCGGRIHFEITLDPARDGADLTLRVDDDAGAIELHDEGPGHGLQGIHDRANALGAAYRFDSGAGNPRHWLQVRVTGLRDIQSPLGLDA
jgi:glucose-6-phosphate-specific signal transduction histidine kinase